MQKTCTHCSATFDVTNAHLAFYDRVSPVLGGKKYSLPAPTLCPDCRDLRRQAHVNEIHLHKGTCGITSKELVTAFHPSSGYTVYDQPEWWGDGWDQMAYGRDFDFNRPFFDQYYEMGKEIPYPNVMTGYQYDENCRYTNYAGKNKNCYLIFDSDECWDCYFSFSVNNCKNCLDCYRVRRSELCYECIDCTNCYGSSYMQDCDNCIDSMFLKNCIGCKNCLMSSNLRNKEFYVENKEVGKEEFEKIKAMLTSRSRITSAYERFEKLKTEYPQKYMHGLQNENAIGDYLYNTKNADHCFDCEQIWDCTYLNQAFMPMKDSMDTFQTGDSEKLYECSCMGYSAHSNLFSASSLECSECIYETFCFHCKNIFGCIGLKHKQYCVFNKQYTKEEYEALAGKIIEHMQKTGEWGEFYPIKYAVFPYNDSLAQDYYPSTKEEVTAKGWKWFDPDKKEYQKQTTQVHDAITEESDDIIKQILACTTCGKNFKIIEQELEFYRDRGFPIPTQCFHCRHNVRLNKRNPKKLWDRECGNCKKAIQTSYDPKRPEKVLCEECYLAAVH